MYIVQKEVANWVRCVFGTKVLYNKAERATRVLEEAIELAQAEKVPKELVLKLVDVVYGKPVGRPNAEGMQVYMTLCAWAYVAGINLDTRMQSDMQVLWMDKTIEAIRERIRIKRSLGLTVASDTPQND